MKEELAPVACDLLPEFGGKGSLKEELGPVVNRLEGEKLVEHVVSNE